MRHESLNVLKKIWQPLACAKEEIRPQQINENAPSSSPV